MYRERVMTPPGTSVAFLALEGLSVVAAMDTRDREDRCIAAGAVRPLIAGPTKASLTTMQ